MYNIESFTKSFTFNVKSTSRDYFINKKSNPVLTLTKGETYTFNISARGHPFWIKTVATMGTNNAYNNGVTNNGNDDGTLTFTVPFDAPSTLYYICEFHSSMQGVINVLQPMSNNVESFTTNSFDLDDKYAPFILSRNTIENFSAVTTTHQVPNVTTTHQVPNAPPTFPVGTPASCKSCSNYITNSSIRNSEEFTNDTMKKVHFIANEVDEQYVDNSTHDIQPDVLEQFNEVGDNEQYNDNTTQDVHQDVLEQFNEVGDNIPSNTAPSSSLEKFQILNSVAEKFTNNDNYNDTIKQKDTWIEKFTNRCKDTYRVYKPYGYILIPVFIILVILILILLFSSDGDGDSDSNPTDFIRILYEAD